MEERIQRIARRIEARRVDMDKVRRYLKGLGFRAKKDPSGPMRDSVMFLDGPEDLLVTEVIRELSLMGGWSKGRNWGTTAFGRKGWSLVGTCGPYSEGSVSVESKDGVHVEIVDTQCVTARD
jgi:hypothetical protein